MSETKPFDQTQFNAAMLTAMDKMANMICLMHYSLLDNPEYAKDIGEQTELTEWTADLIRNWRDLLLESHRETLTPDTVDILEKLG